MTPSEDERPTERRAVGCYAHTEAPWTLTRVKGGRTRTTLRVIYGAGVVAIALACVLAVVEPIVALFLMLGGGLVMFICGSLAATRRGMERFLLTGPRRLHVERAGAGLPEDTLVIDRRRWPVSSVRDVVVRAMVPLGAPTEPVFLAYLLLPGFVVELHAARDEEAVVAVATAVRRGLGLAPEQPAPATRLPQQLGGCALLLLMCVQVIVLLLATVAFTLEVDGLRAGAVVVGYIAVDQLAQHAIRWVIDRNARDYLARELPAAFDGPIPPPQGRAFLLTLTVTMVVLAVLGTIVEILASIVALTR